MEKCVGQIFKEKCVGQIFKLGIRKEELGMKENSEFGIQRGEVENYE